MSFDFINTITDGLKPVTDQLPMDQIEGAIDSVGLKDVVTNFTLPEGITNIFKGTPLEKFLPDGNSNLLKPGSMINKAISGANNELNGIKDWVEKNLLPHKKQYQPFDFSGYILLLMEITGLGVGFYAIYRILFSSSKTKTSLIEN
jgi:hypothetical protein